MSWLLSIPSSDVDSERGHYLLRTKINSDQRFDLVHSTIVSLMSFKFNYDSCCFGTTLPKELLIDSKTYKSLHYHCQFDHGAGFFRIAISHVSNLCDPKIVHSAYFRTCHQLLQGSNHGKIAAGSWATIRTRG